MTKPEDTFSKILAIVAPNIAAIHKSVNGNLDVTVILTSEEMPGCLVFSSDETVNSDYLIKKLNENKGEEIITGIHKV